MKKVIVVLFIFILSCGVFFLKNIENELQNKDINSEEVSNSVSVETSNLDNKNIIMEEPENKENEESNEINEITDNTQQNVDYPEFYVENLNLEDLKEYKLPIMLQMSASWCPPCQKMKPYVERLYEEFKGKVLVLYVDIDEVNTEGFPIEAYPTQFFFNSDGSPFEPSEDIINKRPEKWIFITNEEDEHIFTRHQGSLSNEMLLEIFNEMLNK